MSFHFQIFTLTNTYEFLRDTDGEITRVVGQIHRVFLPSQLSVILIDFLFGMDLHVEHRTSVAYNRCFTFSVKFGQLCF